MDTPLPAAPAIILVCPQMGENIGAAARAMLNCGMTEMRIVAPRDGWPNEAATAMSAGAETILENARLFRHNGRSHCRSAIHSGHHGTQPRHD